VDHPANPDSTKPLLLYDGHCGFCRIWIQYWRALTRGAIEYASSQDRGPEFPQIPPEQFGESVQLVRPDGSVVSGARAVFESLADVRPFWLGLYESSRLFAAVSDACYRVISHHRTFFYHLTRLTFGREIAPASFDLVQWIFLRALAITYAIAFGSLAVQVKGLIGSQGILPAGDFFDSVAAQLPGAPFLVVPSIFWLGASDSLLHSSCWIGCGLACLLALGMVRGVPERIGLAILWALYLSFCSAGQEFLSFQWDALLLEAGFLALFLGRTKFAAWLYRLLVFRLFFLSGAVKLLSHDPSWRDLTAMEYQYHTQPLPNLIAWYADHLPTWFQKASTVGVFVCELGAPFLIFLPRRIRHLGAGLMIGLQILILLTGNYTFFNFLTIALCLFLFDDRTIRGIAPHTVRERLARTRRPASGPERVVVALAGSLILFLGAARIADPFLAPLPDWITTALRATGSFQIVNGYGLFAVMTTTRPEIVVEGSDDGENWQAYEFPFKPGDLTRLPRQVAPLQPRLDWQMWFAALSNYRQNPWFVSFAVRLLDGSPAVAALLKTNPFPHHPPRYVRAMLYDYTFTSFADRRASRAWWHRKLLGPYLPPVSLRSSQ